MRAPSLWSNKAIAILSLSKSGLCGPRNRSKERSWNRHSDGEFLIWSIRVTFHQTPGVCSFCPLSSTSPLQSRPLQAVRDHIPRRPRASLREAVKRHLVWEMSHLGSCGEDECTLVVICNWVGASTPHQPFPIRGFWWPCASDHPIL